MEENKKIEDLLIDIKGLLGTYKKVMNVEDLAQYTGLSKSKIYKLTHLLLIPMGNNPNIRQKFFDKEKIDAWLLYPVVYPTGFFSSSRLHNVVYTVLLKSICSRDVYLIQCFCLTAYMYYSVTGTFYCTTDSQRILYAG